ncbi:unnamed protein product [Anisakis simplex]|uniref:Secreted protein n=1 Tax=Anisakis simplex TaxID=6269 RepID=A0A0M3K6N1_ANISI|nr:unnamed protein product [Anisakis simplex]
MNIAVVGLCTYAYVDDIGWMIICITQSRAEQDGAEQSATACLMLPYVGRAIAVAAAHQQLLMLFVKRAGPLHCCRHNLSSNQAASQPPHSFDFKYRFGLSG